MEKIKDVNFLRLSTRFKVNEVATDVIRFTPAMQTYLIRRLLLAFWISFLFFSFFTYCVTTFINKNAHNFLIWKAPKTDMMDSGTRLASGPITGISSKTLDNGIKGDLLYAVT